MAFKVHCSLKEWVSLVLNTLGKVNGNQQAKLVNGEIVEITKGNITNRYMWAYEK